MGGPMSQSSALRFSDAAGTDPSTDAVPVLNHGVVTEGSQGLMTLVAVRVPTI